MTSTKFLMVVFAFTLGAWCCLDKEAEITQANAAQGEQRVEQQGELRDGRLTYVNTVGDVSFVVPNEWKSPRHKPGEDYVTVWKQEFPGNSRLLVFPSLTLRNKDAAFNTIWNQLVVPLTQARTPDWGTDNHTSVSGYSGKYGNSTAPDRTTFVGLYVLEADNKAIPIIFITPTNNIYLKNRDLIRKFVDRVRVTPAKAQPPKTALTIADLVGEWTNDTVGTHTQKNTATGRVTDRNIAVGKGYKISSDGRYTFGSAGAMNGWFSRSEAAGRVEFVNNEIVFRDSGGKSPSRYWFIDYDINPAGSTLLTLLPAVYEPKQNATPYYEVFVRR